MQKIESGNVGNTKKISVLKSVLLFGTALSSAALPNAALAQDEPISTSPVSTQADEQERTLNEVVIQGIRRTIQDSNSIKRNNTSIVDGLSAEDIGDLPALSIAEALETITSVASQREGSGATEVSIRGLGPFLSSTVINGREATNGSGDRSVNFSQFPSELFNKIEIYKTQEASLIEGGVAGQIALSTLKPLEYGERRVQLQAKFNVNPDNLALDNPARDFGYRLTGSYVDQFDTGIGRFGISVGGQTNITPNPEQEARSSSTFQACTIASLDGNSCNGGLSSMNLDPTVDNVSAETFDPVTGDRIGLIEPFVLTTSSRSFRQNITDDQRNAVFGAVQWQPNDRIDINFDAQYSDREFEEFRSDITFDTNDIEPIDTSIDPILSDGILTFTSVDPEDDVFPLSTALDGSLRTATTSGDIEVNSQFSERLEEYIGFGGSVSFDVTDRLNIYVDGSYSDTSRRENQLQARVVSGGTTAIGVEVLQNGSEGPQFTIVDTDVTDPATFTDDNVRVREDLNQFRNNTIWAIKGDATYDVSDTLPFLKAIRGGARYSVLEYDQVPRIRNEFEFDDGGDETAEFVTEIGGVPVDGSNIATLAASTCANGTFPESSFLDGEINGNLITNIDEDGNVLEAGTGNTFLTFNGLCLLETLLGRSAIVPTADGFIDVANVDVEEETIAGYIQADFDTRLGDFPVRGNVGLRVINTEVTSVSFGSELQTVTDIEGNVTAIEAVPGADLITTEDGISYTEFLPSFNVVTELRDDLLVRGGIFRALSRPDPSDLGAGRQFNSVNDDDSLDVLEGTTADVLANVVASGNPQLRPFLSWNFDAAVEWYPNADTIFAIGGYYKIFDGGFESVAQTETFNVDGQDFDVLVSTQNIGEGSSTIFGFEATASHTFSYLPFPLDGFGFKASYNFADADFDFNDGQFGEETLIDANGVATQLSGLIPPADLPGLSKHTANGQIFYGIGKLNLQGIVKYRSDFFQQFLTTPQNLRFIEDATVFEARISYKISDNVRLSIEGVNLFNEPRVQTNPTADSFAEINVFGPRYFVGLTAKF